MVGHNCRPEKQFGINYKRKFNSNLFGSFNLKYDYKHIGKVEDWKMVVYVRKSIVRIL